MFLEIIDLTVDLDDFKLDKINFSVNKGEYLILIGPTGSGKLIEIGRASCRERV